MYIDKHNNIKVSFKNQYLSTKLCLSFIPKRLKFKRLISLGTFSQILGPIVEREVLVRLVVNLQMWKFDEVEARVWWPCTDSVLIISNSPIQVLVLNLYIIFEICKK